MENLNKGNKMLEYYIDFSVKDSQTEYFINRLFTKIHGYMNSKKIEFSIDFPCANEKTLGNTLRVFSNAACIDGIVNDPRINMYLTNKVIVTTYLMKVPEKILKYVVLRRNRFAEKATYPKSKEKPCHIVYENNANSKRFTLYIDRDIVNESKEGNFTSFGTSKNGATIPLF